VEQEPDPVILTSKRPARAIGPLSSEEQQFSARILGLESVAEVGRHGVVGFLQPYEGADKRALSVEELLARTDPRWERDYRRKRTTRTALALLAVASVVSGVVTLWLGARARLWDRDLRVASDDRFGLDPLRRRHRIRRRCGAVAATRAHPRRGPVADRAEI
jgi:hypothetical protein